MLSEGKFSRYLIYAIGETILLIIGILIALQINNWNEKRKQEQLLDNIFSIVAEDLNNDINEIDSLIQYKEERKSTFNKIIAGLMTKKDYEECSFCLHIIMGFPELTIEKRGFNLLNSYSNNFTSTEDSLRLLITQFYTEQLVEIYADEDFRSNDVQSNFNDWKNSYSWYSDFVFDRDSTGFIEYALNNQDYKNRAGNYFALNYRLYIPKLEKFNKEAKIILQQIEEKQKQ